MSIPIEGAIVVFGLMRVVRMGRGIPSFDPLAAWPAIGWVRRGRSASR